MAEHVDILKTGSAQPLARVVLEDGHVYVLADDEDYWQNLLQQVVGIDRDEHPDDFFNALHERVAGTYVYATPPHEGGDESCPVPDVPWVAHQGVGL